MNLSKENITLVLHVSEVEDIIEDLYFSAKKLNLKYGHDVGKHQENLADKIDLQLSQHLKGN